MKRITNWFKDAMKEILKSDFERYVGNAKDIHELEAKMKNYHKNLMGKNRYD